jgi:membrane-associated phospholipid phosphatase
VSESIRGFHATGGSAAAQPGTKPSDVVGRFDEWADAQLERIRGNPVADAVFTTASRLGEFSLIWHVANGVRALTGSERARQAPVLAALLAAESLVVNQGLKRLFHRPRPTVAGDPRYPVRRPLTSSFPSGHASAAAFNAVILTGWDGRRSIPLWWSLALTVATSRAYVRIHHPSDVVAGLATGAVLGVVARRLLVRFEIG